METVTSLSVSPTSISDSIERGTEFIFVPVAAKAVVLGADSMQIAEVITGFFDQILVIV